mgnify:CR=1 FL=1
MTDGYCSKVEHDGLEILCHFSAHRKALGLVAGRFDESSNSYLA